MYEEMLTATIEAKPPSQAISPFAQKTENHANWDSALRNDDVIVGFSPEIYNYHGNKRFRAIVKERYDDWTKTQNRKDLYNEILRAIEPGRFVELPPNHGIPDRVCSMVAQRTALRKIQTRFHNEETKSKRHILRYLGTEAQQSLPEDCPHSIRVMVELLVPGKRSRAYTSDDTWPVKKAKADISGPSLGDQTGDQKKNLTPEESERLRVLIANSSQCVADKSRALAAVGIANTRSDDATPVGGHLSVQEAGAGAGGDASLDNRVVHGQNASNPTCATGRVEGASTPPFQQDSIQAASESNSRTRTRFNEKAQEPDRERVERTPAKATGSPFAPRKHVTPESSQPLHGSKSPPGASSSSTASMSAQSRDTGARALVSGKPERTPSPPHRVNGTTTPESTLVPPAATMVEDEATNDPPIVDDNDVLVWLRVTGRLSFRLVVVVFQIALFGWHLFGVLLIIFALYVWLSWN